MKDPQTQVEDLEKKMAMPGYDTKVALRAVTESSHRHVTHHVVVYPSSLELNDTSDDWMMMIG